MAEDQKRILDEKALECFHLHKRRMQEDLDPGGKNYTGWCRVEFDNILCWDRTMPGTSVYQPCPEYIHKFKTDEFAVKTCMPDGTWETGPSSNRSWTNYTACIAKEELPDISHHAEHGDRLKTMYTVGYSVSLAALVIAVFIMLCCRRLQSKSNTLHINLFLAFILRAVMASVKDHLFVGGLGLPKDVTFKNVDGRIILDFIQDGEHWECRLITVLFFFAISATQTWILMEGLYLLMLIHKTIITERHGVKPYIISGWALPWLFMIPWIIVKRHFENTLCWTIQENPEYFWILKGPWIAIVIINFFFFIDICWVLFRRVRSNHRHVSGSSKYRKFAKFILVLIPLFGIMYIILNIAFPTEHADNTQEFNVVHLYIEMGYNSFQGFILALLFCFLNEDVHTELRRLWMRHRSRRENSNFLRRSYAGSTWRQVSRDASSPDKFNQPGSKTSGGKRHINGTSVRSGGYQEVGASSPGTLSCRGERRPLCTQVSSLSCSSTGNGLRRMPSDGSTSSFPLSSAQSSQKAKRPCDWERKKKGGTVLLGREAADNGTTHHSGNGGVPAKIIMLDSDSYEEPSTPHHNGNNNDTPPDPQKGKSGDEDMDIVQNGGQPRLSLDNAVYTDS